MLAVRIRVCGASIRVIVPVISGLVLVAVCVVQEGILCRPVHICHTGFCRQEIHMYIQESQQTIVIPGWQEAKAG